MADDDPAVRKALDRLLRGAGFRGLGEAPGVPCLCKPFDEALLFVAIGAVTGKERPS